MRFLRNRNRRGGLDIDVAIVSIRRDKTVVTKIALESTSSRVAACVGFSLPRRLA